TRAHLINSQSDRDFLLRLRQAAAILFEASSSLLFVADHAGNSLVCEPQSFQPGLEFRVPLQPGNNLVADAFLNHTLTSWWSAPDAQPEHWADQQVRALLQTPGLVCLPLTQADGTESVLVLGLQFPLSNDQRQLMRLFAEEVVPNIVPHLMPTDHPALGTTSASAADSAPGDDTFRPPLNFIRRYLDVLLQQLTQASGGPDEQSLRCEATRAASILLNLSLTTHETTESCASKNLDDILQHVTHIFADSLFATKDLHCDLVCDEDLPLSNGQEPALIQIMASLLQLVTDLAPAGGQLMLRARTVQLEKDHPLLELLIKGEVGHPAPAEPAPEDPRLRLAQHLALVLGA